MTGFVYVLKSELGHVKFGFSKTPNKRFSVLKSANSVDFDVLHVIPGTLAQERYIHTMLKPHKVRGEWYHDTKEVRSFIQLVAAEQLPDLNDWRSGGKDLSQDARDCQRAAQAIMSCGTTFGLSGYEAVAAHFGIPVAPIFKFMYRPTEPMVGEYLALMRGCVLAAKETQKHVEGLASFANKILEDHEAGLKRAAEAGARLAALEAELAA
jgi:hypothetical protein